MQQLSRLRLWHWLVILPILAVVGLTGYDYFSRYLSWKNLTKAEIVTSANRYVDERLPGAQVCAYAVVCDRGRARLALVKDIGSWDFERSRQLAWERRVHNRCPGQTANFALEAAPGNFKPSEAKRRAVWSFYNDRFVPIWGRFHGPHAFSEVKAEACSAKYALNELGSPNAAP